ncbi:MAG TPA: alpha/beta fold hydrolase [Intrasporangium sp.]|uniref:alpha/beta fold hydrolase n=1 Tax=Intrasporangium sp. TaxID=1925024 RepID=UPI002D780160|nr:alpha/beta fold hydrolase [Intrasporangium sp.]HET7398845.1 alpha/beta fold hydrolase [Intrasporangium sp.]
MTASSAVAGPATALPAATGAASASAEELRVPVRPEADGAPVTLDVSLWRPAVPGPRPVVLLAHGFGGTKESVTAEAAQLQGRGYLVVAWTARGFGRSGGLIHLNDPAFEVADAKALVDLVSRRDDVQLDREGDPRVGVMGASYGGALALMLAGADERVDGVVAAITWNDLAEAFFPQAAVAGPSATPAGRSSIDTPGPFKQVWASTFFLGAVAGERAAPPPTGRAACGRFDEAVCSLFVDASSTGSPSGALLQLLRAHSPRPTLARVRAPTMLIQGTADSLFGLDQADATARALAATGTPVAVRWSDGGHDGPSTHQAEETDASLGWLDHYVAHSGPRDAALPVAAFTYPIPPQRRGRPSTLWTTAAYPGLTTSRAATAPTATAPTATAPTATVTVPVTGGGALLRPPGGQPAAMVAVPGLAALGGGLATYQIAALPGQSVTLDTGPLPTSVTVVGSPTLRLTVTSSTPVATLFASLWRLEGAQPTLQHPLVAPVRLPVTPGRATTVTVSLPAATWSMPAGSRWRVLLGTTEGGYTNDRTPAALQVQAASGLTLPVSVGTRVGGTAGLDTEAGIAGGAIVVLLATAVATAWLRRRRRLHEPRREDLADVPLVVEGLTKTYADGHRAVDDVSWRAERGQVVGLLGPNGAGKTTTMRMVMGLIRADSGSVHVLGHPVSAGAPVLARVGALIEGPGFLPHLTGRANLAAYWEATGRPAEEARVEEALDVAALGGAVDRPVKSYSHGMRQRLGIAQAMLGMPELLILDEPTNGLDPPQIAAMRPILRRYADTGRTVVISSHMLAEVEMTCTHVVVMHAGRVVTTGLVADLVASDDTTILDLAEGADTERSAGLLAGRPGIVEVRVDTPTRLVVVATLPRAVVVEAAVAVRMPLVGVSSRRHLEEVFLGVIAQAGSDTTATGPGGVSGDGSLIERLRQVRAR